jgi:hypothetical protein
MKIEYICHACLFIDTGDAKIVTDPWFVGPAYCGQWHIFPKPVNVDVLQDSQFILLSHGHEDHFHERSLRRLPKSASVFYPYSWYDGAKPFLHELGYQSVVEAISQKRYQLTADTSVTYIINGMDSIIVIESGGRVFVNINDALHSYPPKIVDLFIRLITTKWPRIDTVFCGFGGASYFPNTLHCPGKNDLMVGQAREQLFAHSFCRIARELQPVVAVPFAADFALLSLQQRWINEVRFPRARLPEYYRRLYGSGQNSPRIQVMYSGDVLADSEFERRSPYWGRLERDSPGQLLDEQYVDESAALNQAEVISEEEAKTLQDEMLENIRYRSRLFGRDVLANLQFTVKVTDLRVDPYLNICLAESGPTIRREGTCSPGSILRIDTSSRILRHSFASDWGGDAITIGYGCDIEVFDQSTIESSLDIVCVRLLTRQPQASRHWRVSPVRLAKHLLTSPTTRTWVIKSFLGGSADYSDKMTNDVMREWLFRTKCEVCRACDLPLLDEEFVRYL